MGVMSGVAPRSASDGRASYAQLPVDQLAADSDACRGATPMPVSACGRLYLGREGVGWTFVGWQSQH